jgi:aminopeptidase-like protein
MMNFIAYCDGKHDLFDIAEKINVPVNTLFPIAEKLTIAELIREI